MSSTISLVSFVICLIFSAIDELCVVFVETLCVRLLVEKFNPLPISFPFAAAGADLVIVKPLKNHSLEMLLGFIQANGFDSSHGYRIDTVDQVFTWVPRSKGSTEH